MRKDAFYNDLTVREPLTIIRNGNTINGILLLPPSRRGKFAVEYGGKRKSDYRTNYTDVNHMRGIAIIILGEMVEDNSFSD